MKLCVWCTVQYNTVRMVAYLYSTENYHWLCNLRYDEQLQRIFSQLAASTHHNLKWIVLLGMNVVIYMIIDVEYNTDTDLSAVPDTHKAMKSDDTQDINESKNGKVIINNPRSRQEVSAPVIIGDPDPCHRMITGDSGSPSPQITMDLLTDHHTFQHSRPSLPWSIPPVHLQGVVQ